MSCSRQSITQAWNHDSPHTARAFFRILLKAIPNLIADLAKEHGLPTKNAMPNS